MGAIIIGFVGLKGSGKDRIATELQTCYESRESVEIFKFAATLKYIAYTWFGVAIEDFENQEAKKNKTFVNGKNLRSLLKDIGTLFRQYYPNVWVRQCRGKMLKSNAQIKIITDVRYENEIEAIKKMGGTIINIDRPTLYMMPKKIISLFGANILTRIIIWFIDRSLTHSSEWNYWRLRKQADHSVTNLELEKAIDSVDFIVREILASGTTTNDIPSG